MTHYKNLGLDSGVNAFEIGNDYITVRFSTYATYKYTYESAGQNHIENMKSLTLKGEGMNSYIKKNEKYQQASYIWDLNSMGISPEDEYEFYLEVFDNDIVNGPNSAKTRILSLNDGRWNQDYSPQRSVEFLSVYLQLVPGRHPMNLPLPQQINDGIYLGSFDRHIVCETCIMLRHCSFPYLEVSVPVSPFHY